MVFSWTILAGLLVASTRFLHYEWSHGMLIHTITGMTIIILTYSLSFPVIDFNKRWENMTWHDRFGLISLGLTGILGIGGFLVRMANRRLRWQTNKLRWIKRSHTWLGYLLLAIA
jgi:hypothetical protein